MNTIFAKIIVPVVVIAGVVGCGSTDTGTDSTTTPATTSAVTTSAPDSPASPGPAPAKIDPNTASTSEMAAAFEAAGVPNAEKWADEVAEYGPYTAESIEPTLTKELGKYGIDSATLATILSVLAPQ